MSSRASWVVVALMVLGVTGSHVLAHSSATGIVKERMDLMKAIGDATKSLGRIIKGEEPYRADAVRKLATVIAGHGGAAMTTLFPEGSMDKPTEATLEIWEDWEEFSKLAERMRVSARNLADAADQPRGSGANSPDSHFATLAKTCSACHDDFRERR